MGQLNFGHIDYLCKATHLDGMTPFWSPWLPLQGDATKWGDPILIASVTFARQHAWMGQPNFNHLDYLRKPTHLD
jgi:hypothetical protein